MLFVDVLSEAGGAWHIVHFELRLQCIVVVGQCVQHLLLPTIVTASVELEPEPGLGPSHLPLLSAARDCWKLFHVEKTNFKTNEKPITIGSLHYGTRIKCITIQLLK